MTAGRHAWSGQGWASCSVDANNRFAYKVKAINLAVAVGVVVAVVTEKELAAAATEAGWAVATAVMEKELAAAAMEED